jgi:trehalose 6-phosphate phosphatase
VDLDRVRSVFGPLLAEPGRAVVACDYDGTLAPIASRPAEALPADGAVEALAALAPLVGRLAVVTGRPVADVVELAGLRRVDGLVVLGLYGAQRWEGGRTTETAPDAAVAAALAELRRILAAGAGGPPASGAWIEDKGGSFGLHVRAAADPRAALVALTGPVEDLAHRHGLVVERGRLVLELRPGGTDKGVAVTALAAEVGSPSGVVFVGDDLGDLAAFDAVHVLSEAGTPAWAVASASPDVPEVEAAADLAVDGPAGVVALLAQLATILSGD